jgi:hypothetical protein
VRLVYPALVVSDLDTVVVPAQDEGFEQVFLGGVTRSIG